ncbi:hypothetical protein CSG_18880 [Campylobacter fetus subsp. venerealis str. 84-112]|nr:hypothetical protein CSG_18880 [Campylobacter fetus subsp. venerealis str. 84-112]
MKFLNLESFYFLFNGISFFKILKGIRATKKKKHKRLGLKS